MGRFLIAAALGCLLLQAALAVPTTPAAEARRSTAARGRVSAAGHAAAPGTEVVYRISQGYTVTRSPSGALTLVPSNAAGAASGAAPAAPVAGPVARRRVPPKLPQPAVPVTEPEPTKLEPEKPEDKVEEEPVVEERDEEYEDEQPPKAPQPKAATPAATPAAAAPQTASPPQPTALVRALGSNADAAAEFCVPGAPGAVLVDAAAGCPEGFSPESGGICSRTVTGCGPDANEVDGQCCATRKAKLGAPVCIATMKKECPKGMFSSSTVCSNSLAYKDVLAQLTVTPQPTSKETASGMTSYSISLSPYDLSSGQRLDGPAETKSVSKPADVYTPAGGPDKSKVAPSCFHKCCEADAGLCGPMTERKIYVDSGEGCPTGCTPVDGGKCKCGDVGGTGRCPSGMKECKTTAGRVCAASATIAGVDACKAIESRLPQTKPALCPSGSVAAPTAGAAASTVHKRALVSEAGKRQREIDRLKVAEELAALGLL